MSTLAPGVYVNEVPSPSYTTTSTSSTQAVYVGGHFQGPTVPTLVQSWGQFVQIFGGFSTATLPTDLQLSVYGHFTSGGGACYVIRVVHEDAVSAAVTLQSAGSASTLSVTASSPGAWGNNLYVYVTEGIDNLHFNLQVFLGGTSAANRVENWQNLDMNQADSRYAPSIINNPYNGSKYIFVSDVGTGSSYDFGNTYDSGQTYDSTSRPVSPVPVTGSPVELGVGSGAVAGADGSVVTSADLLATTSLLDTLPGQIIINFPNVTDTSGLLNPMSSYISSSRAEQNAVLFIDPPRGQTPAAIVSYAGGLTASSYSVIYYPWGVVSDPASNVSGSVRTVPPSAYVIGRMSKIDAAAGGPWVAPAGLSATLPFVALERTLTSTDIGTVTSANVNALKPASGSGGLVIWGARTLSNVVGTQYINVRRLLIYIETNLVALTEFAVFGNNGPQLWNQVTGRVTNFMSNLWGAGALAGSTQSQAYVVVCDSTNNSSSSNDLYVSVGVATQDPAEYVYITVSQGAGGTTVSEQTSLAA